MGDQLRKGYCGGLCCKPPLWIPIPKHVASAVQTALAPCKHGVAHLTKAISHPRLGYMNFFLALRCGEDNERCTR